LKVKFKYRVEFFLLVSVARIAGFLGLRNTRYLAKPLAILFYYLIPIRKKVVKKNLSIAFPQLSKKQINRLAFNNYYSIGISFLEIISVPFATKSDIESIIIYEDPESLDSAKFNDTGLILYTAHFGNWELGAISVGMTLNKTLHVLAKKQKNTLVADWIRKGREKFGNKEILLGSSVRELYKTLRNKGYVGMVGDQRGPIDAPKVDFFGRKTSLFTGTATMALKSNVPVYVAIIARRSDYKYLITFEEIPHSNLDGSIEEKELKITQQYMSILQKNIEKYPEQWFWMHDIWKY
jgi:KDO2-lipid IV(A) lauroyltransferase